MQLESLANELLLDLFEYLDGVHLFRAFHNLNSRFYNLLLIHFRIYHFDFRSISKKNFDIICRQHLPLISDRIISLHLSENDETPNQLHLFISYGISFRQFTQLRSLSFDHIRSTEVMNQILADCRHLPNLTRLNVINAYYDNFGDNNSSSGPAVTFYNNIWSLPELTHCNIDSDSAYNSYPIPTVISSSLKNLSIQRNSCLMSEMTRLLDHTPHLRSLCTLIDSKHYNEQFSTAAPLIRTLKLTFSGLQDTMRTIFQNMPNLRNLTLDTRDIYLNGHEWKQIIVNHLPNIKVFRLKMSFRFAVSGNREEQIDDLLDSFRTCFWLIEHQWFVRCDWNPFDGQNCLYTLPYVFNKFLTEYNTRWRSKSTCPTDLAYFSYDQVHSIRLNNNLLKDFSLVSARFPNIHHLEINLPLNESFASVLPTLDHLISLKVFLPQDNIQYQLQDLFDRASRLYSLTVVIWSVSQFAQLQLTSTSIRRLNVSGYLYNRYFDSSECAAFTSSPLLGQCEVFSIAVTNRTDVLDLVKAMPNLRALIFRCKDDKWDIIQSSSSEKDDSVEWCKDCLPSACSIIRNTISGSDILIWFSK